MTKYNKVFENDRLEKENQEMKDLLAKESNRVSIALENFKKAELEFQKNTDEKQRFEESFTKCHKSLQDCIIITKYFQSDFRIFLDQHYQHL